MPSQSPLRTQGGASSPVATVRFAATARALAAAARRFGLAAPTFRTPPRLVGLDRTVRRHRAGGVVSVRVRNRPWAAVVADMIEGVIAVNGLEPRRANRARADLWAICAEATGLDGSSPPVTLPGGSARPVSRRVA